MKMRFYFQCILCLLLIEKVGQFIGALHRVVEESALLWEGDYQAAFCMRYLAWQKNWQVSHEWLAHLGWDEDWLAEAILLTEQAQQQRESHWDKVMLENCEELTDFFEIYFQPNPDLQAPYPNWNIRYLGDK